jgi:hypothetical protein
MKPHPQQIVTRARRGLPSLNRKRRDELKLTKTDVSVAVITLGSMLLALAYIASLIIRNQ